MALSIALSDLVAPYVLKGRNLNAFHAALSVLRAVEIETATDPFGIAMRGRAEFQGRLSVPGPNGALFLFVNNEDDPPFNPKNRDPVFDLSETSVDFELFAPRVASPLIAGAAAALATTPGFQGTQTVLNDWDVDPFDALPSDFPSSAFVLDLLVNAPTFRPRELKPAKMTDEGILVADTNIDEVTIRLPRLRFRLRHDIGGDGLLHFELLSAGVDGLDDPTDIRNSEFVVMDPPHAFVGDSGVGIGFRSAILDLSQESTPPDILTKTGVGDDWTGLYLPELRLFVSGGANGYSYQFGVTDFLYGFGVAGGISGDFEGAVFNPGGGELKIGARFFDSKGRSFGFIEREGDQARATLPPKTRMVVDVEGGRTPVIATVALGGNAAQAGRLFDIDLTNTDELTIVIAVTDSTSGTPQSKVLTIKAAKVDTPKLVNQGGGASAGSANNATITPDSGTDPLIVIEEDDKKYVRLTTKPASKETVWSLDGGPDSTPRTSFSLEVSDGASRQVKAKLPGTSVSLPTVYFYFDRPAKPCKPGTPDEDALILGLASNGTEAWTSMAVDKTPEHGRRSGGHRAFGAGGEENAALSAIKAAGGQIVVTGTASCERPTNITENDINWNYDLARRRAIAAAMLIRKAAEANLGNWKPDIQINPSAHSIDGLANRQAWINDWKTHHDTGSGAQWWAATIEPPAGVNRPEKSSQVVVKRDPPAPGVVTPIVPLDPPATNPPEKPDWFRSASVKVRIIQSRFIALQLDGEVDIDTMAEQKMRSTGQLPADQSADVHTMKQGHPLAPDNPGDGITAFRFLLQENEITGETTVSFSIGADPSDKDGLLFTGSVPGAARAPRSFARNLLGAYISFWPLLVKTANRDNSDTVNAVISGAELALPPIIAAVPYFQCERVILFGADYLARWHVAGSEANIYFDLQADWSIAIPRGPDPLIAIPPESPLSIRYKAIGLRIADIGPNGETMAQGFDLKPVFDATRGYTIDVARSGGIKVRPPLDRIMKVLAARMSRINPLTLEVELAMGIDLGVVTFDKLGVRVFLDEDKPFEITSIGAHVDIPGGLAGSGYLKISQAEIAGEIDLTIRPIGLRVSSALGIADITEGGRRATGVYVGMNLVLPVGIPLANSGLGLFGFRALFGMHYGRSSIGEGKAVPAMEWLKAAKGEPNKLVSDDGQQLWVPKLDRWSFGGGMLLGTMEGGFIVNLDGSLLLELPGPQLLLTMNARFLSPPKKVGEMGCTAGILAIVELTPAHVAFAIFATYNIERLIEVKVPAEAFFPTADLDRWHFYLGSRKDISDGPGPVVVKVLGIVEGTGYLMMRGEGVPKFDEADLPAVNGFGVAVGAAASFIWGDTDIGLYLKVGGGIDAVVGFDPLMISGTIRVAGELRMFIVSVGADAKLTVTVRDQPGELIPAVKVDGKACGHVDFWFFEISECVSISFGDEGDEPAVPQLVRSLPLKSRSPALLVGTGTDRPIDGSLGDAAESDTLPAPETKIPVVPIDSIPVVSMNAVPKSDSASFLGKPLINPSNLPPDGLSDKCGEKYAYEMTGIRLERIAADGSVIADTVIGTDAPARWWTQQGATGDATTAQLALLTWDVDPAPKAIETSDTRTQTIEDRWGSICNAAAPPAPVLWTFRLEPTGPSPVGWDLAGVPWPDPANTKRSEDADAALLVHEQWRTGVASVDNARGIMPANVTAASVPCRKRTRPLDWLLNHIRIGGRGTLESAISSPLSRGWTAELDDPVLDLLVRNDETSPFRIPERVYSKALSRLAEPQAKEQSALFTALARGEEIARADVLSGLAPAASISVGPRRKCEARILQSPLLDDGSLTRFGNQAKEEQVKTALEAAGLRHGPLDDVVILETGGFERLQLLLLVPPREQATLTVRILDHNGSELQNRPLKSSDFVPPSALPASWLDLSGPWAADVADVMAIPASDPRFGRWQIALVSLSQKDADHVEIGWRPKAGVNSNHIFPWYLMAIEMLRSAEIARHDWDDTQISNEREIITELIGASGTDDAFLYPGSLYRCSVDWKGTRQSTSKTATRTQSFWFRTDSSAPARLDPFVVMTSPSDGEDHFFSAESPRIVFATHDVERLYDAYGADLKVRIQASSGRHPEPSTPAGVSQLDIGPATLKPAGASILSPFEDALVTVLDGKCIPIDGERTRQSVLEINVPLELYTDYILDIVAVPKGTKPTQFTPFVYRRRFSTGAYQTLADFGSSIAGTKSLHRFLPAGSCAANLTGFAAQPPLGQQLDDALAACGIDVGGAPRDPGTTILWEDVSGTPQPVAVLLDADEPLFRSRPMPQKVDDPEGLPGTKRWKLVDQDWLSLEAEPPYAAQLLAPPIRAPGNQRALILLKPGSRGNRVSLALVRKAFPEPYLNIAEERKIVFDDLLLRAPWEE